MATKKIDLSVLSDKELAAELNRRNEEKQKPIREAIRQLGLITTELDRLFLEAGKLCKQHKVFFQYQVETMQVVIGPEGDRTVESAWEESSS